jgi:hypothetical protein
MDQDSFCSTNERYWGCSDEGVIAPSSYFATSLPLVTQGSALRLRLGKGVRPAQKQCSGTTLMTMALTRPAA